MATFTNGQHQHLPMSDFLVSLHTKLEEDETTSLAGTLTRRADRLLFSTRRLLGWARQMARGLRHLHRAGEQMSYFAPLRLKPPECPDPFYYY